MKTKSDHGKHKSDHVARLSSELAEAAGIGVKEAHAVLDLLGASKLETTLDAHNRIAGNATLARLAGVNVDGAIDIADVRVGDLRLAVKGRRFTAISDPSV